jgi:hypothetical protein
MWVPLTDDAGPKPAAMPDAVSARLESEAAFLCSELVSGTEELRHKDPFLVPRWNGSPSVPPPARMRCRTPVQARRATLPMIKSPPHGRLGARSAASPATLGATDDR